MLNARATRLTAFVAGCVLLVVFVALVLAGGDDGPSEAAASTTSTTTAPSPFGSVPDGGTGVVVTDEGLVLPITGGGDGEWAVLTPCARTATVEGGRVPGAHVVLDPGHGGFETGAVADNGLSEADLNLDVSRRVTELLEAEGATVVRTRTDDTRVTLRTRAEIARALQPLLFVSIHHNGGPTSPSDRPGTQVFHQDGVPDAARFGGLVFAALQRELAPFSDTWSAGDAVGVRARLGTDGDDFYGVLRESAGVPAVLIEATFLTADPEAELLTRADVRNAEARAITAAVLEWLDGAATTAGFLPPLVANESAGGGGGTDGCEDPPALAGG